MEPNRDYTDRQLKRLQRKESRMIGKPKGFIARSLSPIADAVEQKIPLKVQETLDLAFEKAFSFIFEKGSPIIDKTTNKERLKARHFFRNFEADKYADPKSLKAVGRDAAQSAFFHTAVSAAEGAGLGLFGVGLPDIPLFIAMLLRCIHETAISFGFATDGDEEEIYHLALLRAAFQTGWKQKETNDLCDRIAQGLLDGEPLPLNKAEEIRKTSAVLSQALLGAKFLQGMPVVGAVGGAANAWAMQKVSAFAALKYEKRYLLTRKKRQA